MGASDQIQEPGSGIGARLMQATAVVDDVAKKLARRRAEGASWNELEILEKALGLAVEKLRVVREQPA